MAIKVSKLDALLGSVAPKEEDLRLLREEGYSETSARNGAAALALAESRGWYYKKRTAEGFLFMGPQESVVIHGKDGTVIGQEPIGQGQYYRVVAARLFSRAFEYEANK